MTSGYGSYGQIGNGKNTSENIMPVRARNSDDTADLSGVAAVAADRYGSAALMHDGTIYAWGYGSYGQLGNAEFKSSNLPVKVIADNVHGNPFEHAMLLTSDGTANHKVAANEYGGVYAWGVNGEGQLGDGSGVNQGYPVMTGTAPLKMSASIIRLKPYVAEPYAYGIASVDKSDKPFYLFKQQDDSSELEWTVLDPSRAKIRIKGSSAGFTNTVKTDKEIEIKGLVNGETILIAKDLATGNQAACRVIITDGFTMPQISYGDNFGVALKSDGSV